MSRKPEKPLRLPNGFGSVTKLSGRRRRPYTARKNGQYLGYFVTYAEGFAFLAAYKTDPSVYSPELITFA